MVFQVRAMSSIVMYKSKFNMGGIILIRVLIIPFEMLLRSHLRNTRSIDLLGSCRGRVDFLRGALLQLW